jgi:hypothetical protein
MLFHITWTTHSPTEENATVSRELFAKWQPPADVDFKGFYGFADGSGGVAIVETDTAAGLARTTAPWNAWLTFSITPILPIEEGVAIGAEAAAWKASVA